MVGQPATRFNVKPALENMLVGLSVLARNAKSTLIAGKEATSRGLLHVRSQNLRTAKVNKRTRTKLGSVSLAGCKTRSLLTQTRRIQTLNCRIPATD